MSLSMLSPVFLGLGWARGEVDGTIISLMSIQNELKVG